MKKSLFIIVVMFVFTVTNAQEQNYRLTLEECIVFALNSNYSRQSLKLSEELTGILYRQAKNNRLPTVNASLSETFGHTKNNSGMSGSAGLNASMTLYQGGALSHSIEQSRLQKEQALYQTEQYENELTVNILQAFLSVLGNEELLKYQQSLLKASEEQLKQGKVLYEAGSIIESDYLLLQGQYASDLNNITDTEISRTNNLLTLKNLLAMNPDDGLEVIHPDTSALLAIAELPTQQEVTMRALEYMPGLKISRYDVDIAGTGVKLARAELMPSVNLNASIGTGHTAFSGFGSQLNSNLNEQAGITVNIPVFNRNSARSSVARSRIAVEQAELNHKQAELSIRQTVVQEYQNVVMAHNRYNVSVIRQNACQKSFDACREQFALGAMTAVDLLQQQNSYISAMNDYIQSKYSFMLYRKILDVYMGVWRVVEN